VANEPPAENRPVVHEEGPRIARGESEARYEAGHLFFSVNGALMAQPFDAGRLVLSGEPLPVAPAIHRTPSQGGFVGFSMSTAGTLAYVPAPAIVRNQLTWVDRNGRVLSTVGPPDRYSNPQLSPDGARIAVSVAREDPRRLGFFARDVFVLGGARKRNTSDDGWWSHADVVSRRARHRIPEDFRPHDY
jgi:hypothetical protein